MIAPRTRDSELMTLAQERLEGDAACDPEHGPQRQRIA
jgi:hypothetical protein